MPLVTYNLETKTVYINIRSGTKIKKKTFILFTIGGMDMANPAMTGVDWTFQNRTDQMVRVEMKGELLRLVILRR